MSWHHVHVHYHDTEGHDALILDAVRPLFDALRDRVPRSYFLRHWKHGPHLRLAFDASRDVFTGAVLPAVHEVVGGYLDDHPSTVDVDPEALLPLHRRLAEYEQEPGPLVPWWQDNTVRAAEPDDRSVIQGGEEAAKLLADVHTRTTDLAFAILDRVRTRTASRLGVAFDLLIATAHGLSRGGVTDAFLSFRSHAEAYLSATPDGPGLRPAWDRHYASQAEVLTSRVRAIVAVLNGRRGASLARQWVDLLTPVKDRVEHLAADGRLALGDYPTPAGHATPLAELSPFHRALEQNTEWWPRARTASWFTVYRVLLNYTYLQLTRVGVRPVDRFLLCHLAANAVEDAYGVSALAKVRA